jgi:hypothetical protein
MLCYALGMSHSHPALFTSPLSAAFAVADCICNLHVDVDFCVCVRMCISHFAFASTCCPRLTHLRVAFAFCFCVCMVHLHFAFAFACCVLHLYVAFAFACCMLHLHFAFAFCICVCVLHVAFALCFARHARVSRSRVCELPLRHLLHCS